MIEKDKNPKFIYLTEYKQNKCEPVKKKSNVCDNQLYYIHRLNTCVDTLIQLKYDLHSVLSVKLLGYIKMKFLAMTNLKFINLW